MSALLFTLPLLHSQGLLRGLSANPPAPPPPVVHIDAVVTDSSGRFVPGLTGADFSIQRQGKAETISTFTYVQTGKARPASSDPFPDVAIRLPGQSTNSIARDPDHRTIVLVVDDLDLSPAACKRVRQAIEHFIDQQLRPSDRVALVRTRSGQGILQSFSSDRQFLKQALQALDTKSASDPDAAVQARRQQFAAAALITLRHVFQGLAELPGRKCVLLFSENEELFAAPRFTRQGDNTESLSDLANRAWAVFYAATPAGLSAAAKTLGVGALAADTGGLLFGDATEPAALLSHGLDDQGGYYHLAYVEEPPTDLGIRNRIFRDVTVKVTRPELQVRARRAFPATRGTEDAKNPEVALDDALRNLSPFSSGDMPLHFTPLFLNTAKAGSNLSMLFYIDPKWLTFTVDLKGIRHGALEMAAAAYGENVSELQRISRGYAFTFEPATYAAVLRGGIRLALALPVLPGTYQVQAAIRDIPSGRVGSASQFMEVPDLASGQLRLSGISLESEKSDLNGTSAARIFRPGGSVRYIYTIYNAHVDAEKRSEVETRVQLFHDGKTIYDSLLKPVTLDPDPDPQRRSRVGQIVLGSALDPGMYLLQITVIDKSPGVANPRTATQTIDFEVQR